MKWAYRKNKKIERASGGRLLSIIETGDIERSTILSSVAGHFFLWRQSRARASGHKIKVCPNISTTEATKVCKDAEWHKAFVCVLSQNFCVSKFFDALYVATCRLSWKNHKMHWFHIKFILYFVKNLIYKLFFIKI